MFSPTYNFQQIWGLQNPRVIYGQGQASEIQYNSEEISSRAYTIPRPFQKNGLYQQDRSNAG